ncbi:MAG: DinB family protein [Gemmatimonadota bacterium]
MTPVVADPVLRGWLEELDALRLDARALTDGLTAGQLNWQPSPGRWSIGQCLDHVTRTLQLYPEGIDRMMSEARERLAAGARPYREGAFSSWFVKTMNPPPKMRVRTMRRVEPPPSTSPMRGGTCGRRGRCCRCRVSPTAHKAAPADQPLAAKPNAMRTP